MNDEQDNENKERQEPSIKLLVESLLFVADEPVSVDRLAAVLEVSPGQVEQAISELNDEYAGRGLRLQQKKQRVQMVTAPEAADWIRRFLGLELTGKLSAAALETLAIIAYRQPVTRGDIEAVRGVNSDSVLRTLIHRGLVDEQGRLEQAGRPIIYGTTFEFLQEFGLSSLDQLPPLRDTDSDD
jgi:segregation and condensation protein B